MQRTTTPTSATTPMLNTSVFSDSSAHLSRPKTRDGSSAPIEPAIPSFLKDSRSKSTSSSTRKPSLPGVPITVPSAARRRGSSGAASSNSSSNAVVTDAAAPPALPDYALTAAARILQVPSTRDRRDPLSPDSGVIGGSSLLGTMLGRSVSSSAPPLTPVATSSGASPSASSGQSSEASFIHQQVCELATKRISTLNYLRKAHEGHIYWLNTYLFERSDLSRMPCFDARKLARRATNYLLLGISIPTIYDLYSSSPMEFLRCLNALLSEFDSFMQLHGESSSAANSLARARLPNMFRRAGGRSRRSASATDLAPMDDGTPTSGAGAGAGGNANTSNGGGGNSSTTPSVMSFAASESDLLPGEEYTYLLTPSLPFDPDFFETFATLCDALVDCYARFLSLIPSPRECPAPVADLFNKADARLRKIIVQGVVKDFEDHGRSHARTEVASIGKVVLGGLM
ncbi:hypothetical protein CDD82_7338 [Ophiocordyceps australis]|uniref:Uncharacterized protein n=1 Tax=Ophiocordyceps australis TaxID=1399860 RepID=A0A2C5XF38_9HYPO|nr:hypothetical protein CDD82_7338 [Ophiocordyceps australis]